MESEEREGGREGGVRRERGGGGEGREGVAAYRSCSTVELVLLHRHQ